MAGSLMKLIPEDCACRSIGLVRIVQKSKYF